MLNKLLGGIGLTAVSIQAFAEVPATVLTAITGAGTDAGTVGSSVFVVLVGVYALKLLRRAL